VAAGVAIVIGTILTFTKSIPFLGGGYELHAVFATSGQLIPGDEVRVAGLPAGKVTAVGSGPHDTARVTMQITSSGQPIHADATLGVEPRLFLEGSFYVALNEGSPSAPVLHNGATIPLARTTIPVQYDQFLDVFDAPVRTALKGMIGQFAAAFGDGRGSASSSTGAGSSAGSGAGAGSSAGSGAGALRGAVREFADALPQATQVEQAFQGTHPGDLESLVHSTGAMTRELAEDPAALRGIVTDTDRVAGALSADSEALSGTVQGFDTVLRSAPSALRSLDRALPVLTSFAAQLRPSLLQAPGPLRELDGLLTQLHDLVGHAELPAFVGALTPVTTKLPALEQRLQTLFPLVSTVSECSSTHIVPVLDEKVEDGNLSTGQPAYLDLLHAGTGLSGLSSDFDANGVAVRAGVTAGDTSVTALVPGVGKLVGSAAGQLEGVDPQWLGPGVSPPWRPDQSCLSQALPNLGARRISGTGGLSFSHDAASSSGTGSAPSQASVDTLLRKALSESAHQQGSTR
jgi:ABC-type transporter Mla subunit MlaD